jgi:hypothetical protein
MCEILKTRAMVLYDCRWVEECVNMGVKVPMGKYIVDPEWISPAERGDGEGERQVEEEGSEVPETGMGVTTNEPQAHVSITEKQRENQDLLNSDPASIEVEFEIETSGKVEAGETNHKFIDTLPKIYVDPTDFISKETLLKAIRHRPTTNTTPSPGSTNTPRPGSKRITSSKIKAKARSISTSKGYSIAGPSQPRQSLTQPLPLGPLFTHDDNKNGNDEYITYQYTFTPSHSHSHSRFRHSGSTSSPSPNSPPIKLHSPHKHLDENKVSQFMDKFKGSVNCELDDVYLRALEGESGAWRIMGLEKA